MPIPHRQPAERATISLEDAARAFARADSHWQVLRADRSRWTDPDRQRELAVAFLRYHSAKLALADTASLNRPAHI